MNATHTPGPGWSAQVLNQYTCPIGFGTGDTREAAIREARESAKETLRTVNANWNWRMARVVVTQAALAKVQP